jgi:putative transposase
MARYLRKEFTGAKYHITVRGNGRRRVFIWDEDRIRFMGQLEESLEQYGVILYAYVLMDNHYHLLIETPHANVSRFMQRLNTAYGMYFRYKHRSPGHIFQGRFGGKLVTGDGYLLSLTRYIHLNPVKTSVMQKRTEREQIAFLNEYSWSSYRGYVKKKDEEEIVDYRWRELIGGGSRRERTRYRRYVERGISRDDEVLAAAMEQSEYAIGDDEFVAEVEEDLRGRQKGDRGDADVRWPEKRGATLEEIMAAVGKVYGCKTEDLHAHGHHAGEAKRTAIGLACRLSGLSNREIGTEFNGMTGAAIGQQSKRFSHELRESHTLKRNVRPVLEELGLGSSYTL